MKTFSFKHALRNMQDGHTVSRASWAPDHYGEARQIWLKPQIAIKESMCYDPILKQLAIKAGGQITGGAQFSVYENHAIQGGYNLSAEDVLSDDWYIVN